MEIITIVKLQLVKFETELNEIDELNYYLSKLRLNININ